MYVINILLFKNRFVYSNKAYERATEGVQTALRDVPETRPSADRRRHSSHVSSTPTRCAKTRPL